MDGLYELNADGSVVESSADVAAERGKQLIERNQEYEKNTAETEIAAPTRSQLEELGYL